MNSKTNNKNSALDMFLWLVVIVLIAGGIFSNIHFAEVSWPIKIIAWLVVVVVTMGIALQTKAGKVSWDFIKQARMEMRKVVWPTRQETVQTTMLVVAMVVVMALLLWGVDTFLLWAVGILTGQAG